MKKTSKFDCVYSSVHKRLLYWIAGLCLVGTFLFPVDVIAQKVTVRIEKGTLDNAFQKIMKSSDIQLVYRTDIATKISCDAYMFKQEEICDILNVLLKNTALTYQKQNGVYNIIEKKEEKKGVEKKGGKISGKIVDVNGDPVIGATVMVKNTSKGTITDTDGNFRIISIQSPEVTIQIKYVGMKPIECKVKLNSDKCFVLEEDVNLVSEVIVTGYQVLSKERASGSFATVSSKEIEDKLQTSLMDRLEGKVAGMTSYGGLHIRGISTINGVTEPLYVVDGVPYEGSLDAINPSEILNITVLKDAAAASIYGARAANGVIVITTRSGSEGRTKVQYNGSIKFTPLCDVDYQNLMTSEELVNFQQELFNIDAGIVKDDRHYLNEVRALLFDNKNGKISDAELEKQLDVYRHRDRYSQTIKEFIRKPAITHQHNLSVSGGSKKYTYALSVNYMQELPYDKFIDNDRMGMNLKNSFKFADWISADLTILGSIYNSHNNSAHSGLNDLTGSTVPSYILYYDEKGSSIPWYNMGDKSSKEIDRLIENGLYDQTYYPLQERSRYHYRTKDNYLNINANVKFTINPDLYFNVIFSKDFGNTYSKGLYDEDAWYVRNMVNNAAQITDEGIIYNIPTGGQVNETRSDKNAYTLRIQGNYSKLFGEKHCISVIAGAERRAMKTSSTIMNKVGWDDEMMVFKLIDEEKLASRIQGTESLLGDFDYNAKNGYTFIEDRYVSFYGNAAYTFDERATLTGSIRIDQSNLFGSDPKYQYRPLWSVGGSYIILKNHDWIDRLSARMTYGINGNIPKTTGPYLTISSAGINTSINDYQYRIETPENPGLRWEKTAVYNVGVDFNLFKNRLGGSIDFYNKSTSDLLHTKTFDPTLGWGELTINYGEMYNRGVEINLHSVNIRTKDFVWTSDLNFSYNKNKITKLEVSSKDVAKYIGSAQICEGKPMNSMYSVRWAGLDDKGAPQAYKKDGTIVKSLSDLTVDDLVYNGTTIPPYAASLDNSLRYKNLTLSFLFTFYGGNTMRGIYGDFLNRTEISNNQDRLTNNFWRKPGDENNPNTTPAVNVGASINVQNIWKAADKHMQPADFIKLNQINVAYSVPKNLWCKGFIRDLRITLQIDNVWKWVANDQDLDPEVWVGNTLYSSRGQKKPATYSLGISCSF